MTHEMKFSEKFDGPSLYAASNIFSNYQREIEGFVNFALSHLTIEEFKEALTMAMQCKANNGGVKCITRPFEPSKPSINIGTEVAKIMSEKYFEEVKGAICGNEDKE